MWNRNFEVNHSSGYIHCSVHELKQHNAPGPLGLTQTIISAFAYAEYPVDITMETDTFPSSLIYSPEYQLLYVKHKIQAIKAFESVHKQRSFLNSHYSTTLSPYPEFPKRDCNVSKACHIFIIDRR